VSTAAVDQVFAALADPTRRALLELLGRRAACSATALAADLPISRQAVVQHLAVLEAAGLVRRDRAGREVLFRVEPDRLDAAASWLSARASDWQHRLQSLKRAAEEQ
jgi:DNA-binding transcriptional ArsR family regulator